MTGQLVGVAAAALALGVFLGALTTALIMGRPSHRAGKHRSVGRRHSPAARGYWE